MPYPYHILENAKISAPAQDVETFIRHILGKHHFRVERQNLDETNKRFHLRFSQRHLGLDRYSEGNKPAYIHWGGAEILDYSDSTEIIRMWASSPEDWYIHAFLLDKNKEMEERFGWLEDLSNEIKAKFEAQVFSLDNQALQITTIDRENITLGELEERIQAGDKEAIEFWEKEINPMLTELAQAMVILVEKTFENDPSKPFFDMLKAMAKSENPVHKAIIRPYDKWPLKKVKEEGRKLLESEMAESAKRIPDADFVDHAVQRIAINSTGVIAGSDYDNLPLKELKHKAARFDAIRSGRVDVNFVESAEIPVDTTGWDRILIEMWNKGHSRDEIANRVSVSKDRVTNRITELRNKFGNDIVPYDKDRKKRLIKS